MGSLFTKMPEDIKVQGYLGQEIDVPFYLQFVPGIVLQVVTGKSSQKYKCSKQARSKKIK